MRIQLRIEIGWCGWRGWGRRGGGLVHGVGMEGGVAPATHWAAMVEDAIFALGPVRVGGQ